MNDQKIRSAIKDGDESAIDYVMTKYSKLLWKITGDILGHAASVQDIEECVADVFIYLWTNPDRYDPARGKLKTWLTIVARTKAIDRFRALTRHSVVSIDDTLIAQELNVLDGVIAEDTKALLTAAVNALREPDREILLRRYYCAQKPKAIAAAMNLSVKQVENHLYRTKCKLRRTIETLDREA